jgi:ubiquinone/menaquinone biosynthesis C-methylase UbiE
MERPHVDYQQLAPTYHLRYAGPTKLEGITSALRAFQARNVLEVGCGTGHFVESLRTDETTVMGLDASTGMLSQASARLGPTGLVAAHANHLPIRPGSFDFIYCVNAIHHFDDPRRFIIDAAPLLKPGGWLAIVGMDPRTIRQRYYYDYFKGALSLDLKRYPSFGQLVDWTAEAQLDDVELAIVERSSARFVRTAVLDDPFLKKESNSLLALLSNDAYQDGLRRIEADANKGAEFYYELCFGMIKGRRRPIASATETA